MKRNSVIKRVVSLLLLSVMLLSLGACGSQNASNKKVSVLEPMEIEEVASYSLDAIGGSDVMPIAGFIVPHTGSYSYDGNQQPDLLTDDIYQKIAECGVNYLSVSISNYSENPDQIIKSLELGEKYGIAVMVDDRRLVQKDLPIDMVDAYINEYANYSSFGGIYIVDEPGSQGYRNRHGVNIDDYMHMSAYANELDVFAYHNLFPTTIGSEEAYEEYLQEFVDKFQPKYVQYDVYPFNTAVGDMQRLFSNIHSIDKVIMKKNNIPAWAFVQAGSQYNDGRSWLETNRYAPTRGEFMWDIGLRLACGAKGIHYFPLVQPYWFGYSLNEPFDFQRSGLFGAWGNKTRWWYYAKDMNAQIQAVDHVLMNAQHKGVILSGELAKTEFGPNHSSLLGKDSWRELEKVSGDAAVGCFNYKGKTALYIVSYDREYAQKVKLDWIDNFEFTVIQDAKEQKMTGESLELTFEAGGSALIVFE